MKSDATTVEGYLASLPEDRRAALSAIRDVILKRLPAGYAEGMQYGMIGYFVPHSVYPAGYHCDPRQPLPFASIASQKNHMAIYMMCIYADPEQEAWFRAAWLKTGKKLDMGKSCVRFKRLEDVPLDVVGKAIARVPVKKCIGFYEAIVKPSGKRAGSSKAASKSTAVKKRPAAGKKTASRKATSKKATSKKTAAKKATSKKATSKKAAVKKTSASRKAASRR